MASSAGSAATPTLVTVGHGLHPAAEFGELLRGAGVRALVDIRTAPGSRRAPQFGRDAMTGWLPAAGVSYRWERRLGGFRRVPPGSPDVALRNGSFRGYAAHMRTPEFTEAIAEVVAQAAAEATAVMCSESVWWRCHRRLVADHVSLLEQVPVRHLLPDGRLQPHLLTAGVRVVAGQLVYDGGGLLPGALDQRDAPPGAAPPDPAPSGGG